MFTFVACKYPQFFSHMQTITTQSIFINLNRYKMADISLYAEDIVMCTVCCSKCSRHGTTFRRRVSTVKQTPPVYGTKLQFWQFNLFSGHGYTFEGPRKLPNLRYLGWRVTHCFTSKGVGYFFLYYVSIPICCNSFCLYCLKFIQFPVQGTLICLVSSLDIKGVGLWEVIKALLKYWYRKFSEAKKILYY